MKPIAWNEEKNELLKKKREISFKEVEEIIKSKKDLLDIIDNPSKNFTHQRVYVIKIKNYIYYVPFVEDEEKIFLKTIYPSRAATKKYLQKGESNEKKE